MNPLQTLLAEIPVRTRTLNIQGSESALWEFGPENAQHTVVIVHGFRGTHHGLANLIALMPDVRFIAPDLPGFGDSTPMSHEHSAEGYAKWLIALLSEEDPSATSTVLGHSFGSMIVAQAVSRMAERDLVLVNPIAENALDGPERLLTNLGIFYYRAGAALPNLLGHTLLSSPVITRVMSEVMAVTRDRALRSWIHAEHHEHFSEFANREVLLEAFKASVSTDVSTFANQFPAATTLVAGERDQIATLAATRRLHEKLTDSSLYVIEGVGHLIHYETPKPLARLVRAHLDAKTARDSRQQERVAQSTEGTNDD